MSRANILNTGTASYLELIGNDKTYRCPRTRPAGGLGLPAGSLGGRGRPAWAT